MSTRSRTSGAFHGLRQIHTGLAPSLSCSSQEPSRRCRLRLMLRTGQLLHPASTPASQPKPGASLPGTLASPRTGLSPAGCRELLARLRHDRSFAFMASGLWTHVDRGLERARIGELMGSIGPASRGAWR